MSNFFRAGFIILCLLCLSSSLLSAVGAAENHITVSHHWGKVVFQNGFPESLVLNYGSGEDLLPGLKESHGLGAVEYKHGSEVYSTVYDREMGCEQFGDSLV